MADEKKIKKIDDPFELLNQIASVGKVMRDVKISENLTITLDSLNAEDEGKVFSNTDSFDGTEYFMQHKIETIAFATCQINGKSLREYEKISDIKEREKIKADAIFKIKNIVKTWNDDVLAYVYGQYAELALDSDQKLLDLGILVKVPETPKGEEAEDEKKDS